MNKKTFILAGVIASLALLGGALPAADSKDYPGTALEPSGNPIFTDAWTCDPAPLVVGDRLFVYTGEDIYKDGEQNGLPGNYNIAAWRCYSTTDMVHWTSHGVLLKPEQFPNGRAGVAWAAQVVQKGDKFYWYVTYGNKDGNGNSIGVAIADSPVGPFKPVEKPVITDNMTTGNDIDPTVLIDDDGTAWLAWGQTSYLAKLKDNMTEIDGEIINLGLQSYIEGPWLYKRNGLYYNIYAGFGGMGGFGGFGGGNRPAGGPGAGGNRPAGGPGGQGGNRPAGGPGGGQGGAPAGGPGAGGMGGFGGGFGGGMGGFGGFGGGAPGAGAAPAAGGPGAGGNRPAGGPGGGQGGNRPNRPAGGFGGGGGFGESINYSTAEKITGPWTFRGQVTGSAENSFTIHPGVVDFKGHTYLFYHNGKLDRDGQTGQSLRRSVCVDELFFNEDGTIKAVTQTKEGIKEPLK